MQSHAICNACRASPANPNITVAVSNDRDPDVCLQRDLLQNKHLPYNINLYFESLQTRPKQSNVVLVTVTVGEMQVEEMTCNRAHVGEIPACCWGCKNTTVSLSY